MKYFKEEPILKLKYLYFDDSLAGVEVQIPGQTSIFDHLKPFITSAIMKLS